MKIKLIIWDLDDTLWRGTLAEKDQLKLIDNRVSAIRELNKQGVVHSICSKNDAGIAFKKLEEFGLLEEFVFPRISFTGKGLVLKKLIQDMNLRAENTLFVDDNEHNLGEAKYFNPELNVMDAKEKEFDDFLIKLISETKDIKKSRVNQYKILEEKLKDKTEKSMSRDDFLIASDINISIAWRTDNIEFADRIE